MNADTAARPEQTGAEDTQIDPAEFAPPVAPMAMPKQVLERSPRARAFRLPLFGGRMQGQP